MEAAAAREEAVAVAEEGRFGGGGFGGRQVPAGAYRVVLVVDGQSQSQSFTIEGDPVQQRSLTVEDDDEENDENMVR